MGVGFMEDRRTATPHVFVIHGRNHVARDAMFQFLESLHLRPLTWEAAGDLTGKGTPGTLESVVAGLDGAQAVIVLLTGDDLARLRTEFGREQARTQPRPNVLLEAGMALAKLGQERVILVRHRAARELTDLSGLNVLEIDNTAESRQALVGRLARAGCVLPLHGQRHLSKATGGDFDRSMVLDGAPPFLERGGFDNNIVDSSISYRTSNIQLLDRLKQQLTTPGSADLKFSYLGVAGATNWLNLRQEAAYAASDVVNLMWRAIPKLFRAAQLAGRDIDLVSLGPGDGELDVILLRQARAICNVRNYYPIDISIELLQQTVERATRVCQRPQTCIKAILGDFLELPLYRPIFGYDDAVNVVSLIGFTFGNYDEGMLLKKLRSALNPGDFVVIDARLHDLGQELDLHALEHQADRLLARFANPANNRFAFGPVEMATVAEFSAAKISQELSMVETAVDGAFNVITYCDGLNTRFRDDGAAVVLERLDLASTTFYDLVALEGFIEEKGFTVRSHHQIGEAVALLLQRR
jgi:SAM-dependent methyltransferase